MYIQLWDGLRTLMQDNTSTAAQDKAKLFINWGINDIANEFDWEFLRGTKSMTFSANGTYDLNFINQLTGLSANIYAIASSAADHGVIVGVNGKYINSTTSGFNIYSSNITLSGASASASQAYSTVDAFTKPVTTGPVFFTNGNGNLICTMGATDTYVANDIRKINAIVDQTNDKQVVPFNYSIFIKGSPDESVNSNNEGYDLDYNLQLRIMNLQSTYNAKIVYQRRPKYLVNNWDRTEFPEWYYQDIINYCYECYGKRYQDEADAVSGAQLFELKKTLINEIIRKHTSGRDRQPQRILPRGYRRIL